jgi:hypothetical protein
MISQVKKMLIVVLGHDEQFLEFAYVGYKLGVSTVHQPYVTHLS